jgi:glycosyltransferase involved in cell wall biosynthesis
MMKVSCFTFLRNAEMLGYPFLESIRSALPLCDEFIVNVGVSEDRTLEMVRGIGDPKIRIIENTWNERMRVSGYVYGQQKSIAHYNCTGDWAFYLEADEVLHEKDLPAIRRAMEENLDDPQVEALVFDYLHFYGNHMSYAWSPGWYRRAPRIIRNTVRSYSPDGLYFVVLDGGKKGRYPRAAHAGATVYHYGWVRSEAQMSAKMNQVEKYWGKSGKEVDYSQIDPQVIREFTGSHPALMAGWLPKGKVGPFQADPCYSPSKREKRHRLMMRLERLLGLELSKKHFRMVR